MMIYYTGKKTALIADLIATAKRVKAIRSKLPRDEHGLPQPIGEITRSEIHRHCHRKPGSYSEMGSIRGR